MNVTRTLAAANSAARGPAARRHLTVAVPGLESISRHSGIGRVLWSLAGCWGSRVRLVPACYQALPLPVLRNNPHAVYGPETADLILLPQLTGAQALRNTGGVPSLVIVHDIGIVDFPGDREGLDWITDWSIRQSLAGLRSASHIIAVSDFTRSRLAHHLPGIESKVSTVRDGVDESYLHFSAPRQESIEVIQSLAECALGSPLLIYVGSEHPRKNIAVLLDAFAEFQRAFPGAQLLKVGRAGSPNWRKATLEAARRRGLYPTRDILFLEGIDDEALAHAYRSADLFITASLYEGFGLPALEAMALGTPAVVTNRGALPEVVGPAGWVVEPDASALARAAISAIDDPTRQDRVRLGKMRAEHLNWSAAAERYLDVFGEHVR